jgi:hypothetical protein
MQAALLAHAVQASDGVAGVADEDVAAVPRRRAEPAVALGGQQPVDEDRSRGAQLLPGDGFGAGSLSAEATRDQNTRAYRPVTTKKP